MELAGRTVEKFKKDALIHEQNLSINRQINAGGKGKGKGKERSDETKSEKSNNPKDGPKKNHNKPKRQPKEKATETEKAAKADTPAKAKKVPATKEDKDKKRAENKCYTCGKLGHYPRFCPDRKTEDSKDKGKAKAKAGGKTANAITVEELGGIRYGSWSPEVEDVDTDKN